MPDTTQLLSQFYIQIDGNDAPDLLMRNLVDATVENTLHLPDVATLRLHDPSGKWVDDQGLAPGTALQISAKVGDATHLLFDGEIVEMEPDFLPGERRLIIRAFDRLHRLARGKHVRSFVNVNDKDIIEKIAGEVGLSSKVGPTTTVHPYVLQDNVTNLEFLQGRAALLGYLLFVQGKELHCEKHGTQTATVNLTYGEDLREFHPRLTTVDQVNTATASGWDPVAVAPVVGKATSGTTSPELGPDVQQGGDVAKKAFSMDVSIQVADRPIRSQAVADQLAQASLDRRAGRFIEAEGVTHGIPTLIAGASVDVKGLGTRFSGKYFVTSATHEYGSQNGYVTRFNVSGFRPPSLLSLVGSETDGLAQPRIGLVVGVITDNNDPDGGGRVKVKYPWLSQEHASDWARVVVPGGGAERGMQFLPEVNDEVLVGFEQGDINFPYVLGGLWNGKAAPPSKTDKVIASGKVNQRIIRSRTGHIVTLDDSDDKPSITIVDQTGKNKIEFDSKNNKLTVHFEGDMLFEAPKGDIAIKGKTIHAEATDAMTLKGKSVDASGDTSFDIKAGTGLKLKGATADMQADGTMNVKGATTTVEGQGTLSMKSSGMAELKGSIINVG